MIKSFHQKKSLTTIKVINLIQNELSLAHPKIHKTRLNILFTFVHSGLIGQKLTVTYLKNTEKRPKKDVKNRQKYDIKRADCLCANTHLHSERIKFSRYMTESLIVKYLHPLLIVDWSAINGNEIFQLLCVSIPMGGRVFTIYEKTYEESELNTGKAHQAVLDAIE